MPRLRIEDRHRAKLKPRILENTAAQRDVRLSFREIARVNVHRAAFAPSRMTTTKHRAVMAAPTYRPELDLYFHQPTLESL